MRQRIDSAQKSAIRQYIERNGVGHGLYLQIKSLLRSVIVSHLFPGDNVLIFGKLETDVITEVIRAITNAGSISTYSYNAKAEIKADELDLNGLSNVTLIDKSINQLADDNLKYRFIFIELSKIETNILDQLFEIANVSGSIVVLLGMEIDNNQSTDITVKKCRCIIEHEYQIFNLLGYILDLENLEDEKLGNFLLCLPEKDIILSATVEGAINSGIAANDLDAIIAQQH